MKKLVIVLFVVMMALGGCVTLTPKVEKKYMKGEDIRRMLSFPLASFPDTRARP